MSADTGSAMRAPEKIARVLVSVVASGAALASCMLDLAGHGSPTAATGTGGAPGMITSTATGTGGGTSTATGGGGSGGTAPHCGNAAQEAGEECDDGNLELGDGCSPMCTIEHLDECPGLPIQLAPPGITIKGTLASAHDDLAPGCRKNEVDVVYEVTPTTSGTLTVTLTGAFDKSVAVRSSCSDSKTGELACGAGQGDLTLRKWVYANVKYYVVVDAAAGPFSLHLALSSCGDGQVELPEDCDNAADPTCIGCFKCSGSGEIFDPSSRHCYRRLPGQAKDWSGARSDCLAWGGDLAGVSSLAETNFLKAHFNDVWTGATDVVNECTFVWVNGEPWQPHWSSNEPSNSGGNENCGVFYNSGYMNDVKCDENHDALCERAPGGSCGDQIVQPGEECDDAITYPGIACASCVVVCPPGEIKDPATHHCYRFVTGADDWNSARDACFQSGAYLATISSLAENKLILPGLTGPMWIGASRNNNAFDWINTDAFCFANWNPDPPSGGGKDCATLQVNGSWTTDACDQQKGYVCERDN